MLSPDDELNNRRIYARKAFRAAIVHTVAITLILIIGLAADQQPTWVTLMLGVNAGMLFWQMLHHWSDWRWQRLLAGAMQEVITKEKANA